MRQKEKGAKQTENSIIDICRNFAADFINNRARVGAK